MRNLSNLLNACAKFSLVAVLIAASFACGAVDWDEKQYNPKPAAGDVVLPMPCGGAMAFRKVDTEADGALGDQIVRLGDPNPEAGYLENAIEIPVAGAFPGEKPRTRYFLLGKYELTQLQYQSVMSPTCPTVNDDGKLPQASLSWFDTVEFANKYTLWLLKNAPGKLPGEGDAKGYVRLPTEAEWEFSARGGLQTSYNSSLFQQSIFPLPNGGLNQYVWYNGGDSVNNGKAQRIGLLNPNPLGLHDILGNVDEIVFDPFHMTRNSRLHGQAGAYVVRGGNFLMDSSRIRSSYRQEVPYYKDSELRTTKATGVRLAVAGAVLNAKILRELPSQWEALQTGEKSAQPTPSQKTVEPVPPKPVDTQSKQVIAELQTQLKQCQVATPGAAVSSCPELMPNLSAQSLADPVDELGDLIAKANQPTLKTRLSNLRVKIAADAELLNQKRDQAAREALRTASMICQKLHDDYAQVVKRFEELSSLKHCDSNSTDPDCPLIKAKLERFSGKVQFNKETYADAVIKLSQNYPQKVLESQKSFLLAELERKSYKDFALFVNRFYEDTQRFHQNGKIDADEWYKSCKQVELK